MKIIDISRIFEPSRFMWKHNMVEISRYYSGNEYDESRYWLFDLTYSTLDECTICWK